MVERRVDIAEFACAPSLLLIFIISVFLVEAESTGIPLTLALNKAELIQQLVLVDQNSWLYKICICICFCSYS
ncbi:hypothetical protein CASFOL_042768 [Castilleja foliolosa]|uniref:Uncharacterized protein n=1 Tax=Castilleja foliolosa TaxID=1961234 RepID=A0ABD3B7M6_9LAMI